MMLHKHVQTHIHVYKYCFTLCVQKTLNANTMYFSFTEYLIRAVVYPNVV